MSKSCATRECLWSDEGAFCKTLKQSLVPLDNKWPPIILYLRGISQNPYLTQAQKADMQSLLLEVLRTRDFSASSYEAVLQRIHSVLTAPYVEKIKEITKEASELARDVNAMVGRHREGVSALAEKVDHDLAKGEDPTLLLTNLRSALKDVISRMTEDAVNLVQLSLKDSLTGLANRRRFDEFLSKAVRDWQTDAVPLSLIMLDIDHFKRVNDTFGHRVGDQVLQTLSRQICRTLEPLDEDEEAVLVARYGGEEFAVILRGLAASRTIALAEAIRKSASKIAVVLPSSEEHSATGEQEQKIVVSVSLGVAAPCKEWGGSYQANLVDFADKALYRAKSSGRNCTVRYVSGSDDQFEVVSC